MVRGFNKFLFGVISLILLQSVGFALDNEFKNSLIKIELLKINENSYNIDLYTQNKFSQPIKVIKKSDLNYYILLPETKNNTSATALKGNDIRNITVDLYPYAGQDSNNGYTKININTTKPINFSVNMKNKAQNTLADEKTALKNNEPANEKQNIGEVEKKNSQVQSSNQKKETKNITSEKKSFKEKQNEVKIEDLVAQEVEKARNQALLDDENFDEDFDVQENEEQGPVLSNEDLREIEQIASPKFKTQFIDFKNKTVNFLAKFNLRVLDVFFIGLVILFAFVMIIKLLSKKTKAPARIRTKEEIKDLASCNCDIQPEAYEQKVANDGQYFVFDKNIKQTGFCDPATSNSKRNYELSSYEPDLKSNYNRNDIIQKNSSEIESEYDIIQKILKSDSFIEIEQDEFKKVSQAGRNNIAKKQQPVSTPIKEEIKEEPVEPVVLSEIEIAPKRGFMCVSYNDNISLMGYIFDDVFALYNFKQQKLENYEIKYRLTEKDGKNASFIVKVADTKMLVKVTKSSMNMEVLL